MNAAHDAKVSSAVKSISNVLAIALCWACITTRIVTLSLFLGFGHSTVSLTLPSHLLGPGCQRLKQNGSFCTTVEASQHNEKPSRYNVCLINHRTGAVSSSTIRSLHNATPRPIIRTRYWLQGNFSLNPLSSSDFRGLMCRRPASSYWTAFKPEAFATGI